MKRKYALMGILLFPALSLHTAKALPSLEITSGASGLANIFRESQPVVYGVLVRMFSSVCSDLIGKLCPDSPSVQLFVATTGTDFTNRVIRLLREDSSLQTCSEEDVSETNSENDSSVKNTLESTLQKSLSYGKQLAVPSLIYGAGVTTLYKLLSCLSSEKLAYFTAALGSAIAQFALDSDFYTCSIKHKIEHSDEHCN